MAGQTAGQMAGVKWVKRGHLAVPGEWKGLAARVVVLAKVAAAMAANVVVWVVKVALAAMAVRAVVEMGLVDLMGETEE